MLRIGLCIDLLAVLAISVIGGGVTGLLPAGAPGAVSCAKAGPAAIYVGVEWRVFGRHEAIRSCGEVNDLIVWFLGEGLPSVDLAHGDLDPPPLNWSTLKY